MKITREQVIHVADLARLKLTEEEQELITKDLENVINFADKLNELDIDNIDPTAHVIPIQNVFREDIKNESFDREELLKNAPESEEGCYSVPKIVE